MYLLSCFYYCCNI